MEICNKNDCNKRSCGNCKWWQDEACKDGFMSEYYSCVWHVFKNNAEMMVDNRKSSKELVISDEDIDKLTVGMEINSQWKLVQMRKLMCNNWRKMHHLPIIRRSGKRK